MGKEHFCFFQTAETGNQTPSSGVKGSGANHYPRAPAPDKGNTPLNISEYGPCTKHLKVNKEANDPHKKIVWLLHCFLYKEIPTFLVIALPVLDHCETGQIQYLSVYKIYLRSIDRLLNKCYEQ